MDYNQLENVIEQALMAHRSAVWWQEQMNADLLELQKMEVEDLEDLEDYDNLNSEIDWGEDDWSEGNKKQKILEEKIECMLTKGRWEDKNLEKVMKNVELFNHDEKRHIVSEITKRWAAEKSQDDSYIP